MSEEAANAFLKTLEEPAPRSHVFLCAEDPSRLPKTILSRATELALRRVAEGDVAAALERRGVSREAATLFASRADGRPGLAAAFLEGNDMVDWYETEERRFRSLRGASMHRRFNALADLAPPRADREETVIKLRGVLALWRSLLRKELLAGGLTAARNLRSLQALHASLDANVQPRLLLERFALAFDRGVAPKI
jgi:DNA polymerase-3 subunit delta'